jgi:hypothetical protein
VWAHEVKQLERGCLLIETGELLPDVKLEVRQQQFAEMGHAPRRQLSTASPVRFQLLRACLHLH